MALRRNFIAGTSATATWKTAFEFAHQCDVTGQDNAYCEVLGACGTLPIPESESTSQCIGGAENGNTCIADADCPDGTCVPSVTSLTWDTPHVDVDPGEGLA